MTFELRSEDTFQSVRMQVFTQIGATYMPRERGTHIRCDGIPCLVAPKDAKVFLKCLWDVSMMFRAQRRNVASIWVEHIADQTSPA